MNSLHILINDMSDFYSSFDFQQFCVYENNKYNSMLKVTCASLTCTIVEMTHMHIWNIFNLYNKITNIVEKYNVSNDPLT